MLTSKDVRADLPYYGQVSAPEQFRKKASASSFGSWEASDGGSDTNECSASTGFIETMLEKELYGALSSLRSGRGRQHRHRQQIAGDSALKITLSENIRASLQRRLRLRHFGVGPTAQQ